MVEDKAMVLVIDREEERRLIVACNILVWVLSLFTGLCNGLDLGVWNGFGLFIDN